MIKIFINGLIVIEPNGETRYESIDNIYIALDNVPIVKGLDSSDIQIIQQKDGNWFITWGEKEDFNKVIWQELQARYNIIINDNIYGANFKTICQQFQNWLCQL